MLTWALIFMLTWVIIFILTWALIFAGLLANSGDEANVVSSSTALSNGRAASAHLCLFSSVKSLSKACGETANQNNAHIYIIIIKCFAR